MTSSGAPGSPEKLRVAITAAEAVAAHLEDRLAAGLPPLSNAQMAALR